MPTESHKIESMPSGVHAAAEEYAAGELSVRMLEELKTDRAELTNKTYFEGGDILYCLAGEFRFSMVGADTQNVVLHPGEILFTYPDNFVTIRASKDNSQLRYVILNGTEVDRFFGSFGIYHALKLKTDGQSTLFQTALQRMKAGDQPGAISTVQDMLRTLTTLRRRDEGGQLTDAIRIILRNLHEGNDRLKPVYDELGVSRATLHRMFASGGMASPGEFLRREKYRYAHRLLTTTTLPMTRIAKLVGCSSNIYFNEFIKRCSGKTPTQLRHATARAGRDQAGGR